MTYEGSFSYCLVFKYKHLENGRIINNILIISDKIHTVIWMQAYFDLYSPPSFNWEHHQQEGQLSQRGHTMLSVI